MARADSELDGHPRRVDHTARSGGEWSARPIRDNVEFHRDLYTFDAGKLADLVRELGGPEETLMVVGHNPALENLLGFLVDEYRRFPTAALARVRLRVGSWSELDAGAGQLAGLWLPRELE